MEGFKESAQTVNIPMRQFNTGATRSSSEGKLDFEGFLSPRVLISFAQYLHKHRLQTDGKVRDSDNWQKGIPEDVYMKSLCRHFIDVWSMHRGFDPVSPESFEDALNGILFNAMGYLFEHLKEKDSHDLSYRQSS